MTSGSWVVPPALRARIDGTVMRLPGTGDGVARLVAVSMVKVLMGSTEPLAPTRDQRQLEDRVAAEDDDHWPGQHVVAGQLAQARVDHQRRELDDHRDQRNQQQPRRADL